MRWGLLLITPLLAGCFGPAPFAPNGIVAFGDSYTLGAGAEPDETYPALLAASLGEPVLNAGKGGDTAFEGLARLDEVLRYQPRLVIVMFGANEAFQGFPVQRALDGLDEILLELEEHGIQAILVGTTYWENEARFNEGLEALGQRHSVPVVLNVLEGILEDPGLRSDRYHPNAAGYAIMEARIRPAVQETLAGD